MISTLPAEDRQQAVLRRYHLLDNAADPALDELTALAAEICEAPIGLISLFDGDRLWFKSKTGVDLTEVPCAGSFCEQTKEKGQLFVVQDASTHPLFAHNALVAGEAGIRFYAGAPLYTADKDIVGTLCVLDQQARELTVAQERGLLVLSRQIMAQFELHRRTRKLAESMERSRSILESALDGIIIIDQESRITGFNPAAEEIFGWTREEVLGKDMADLLIPAAFREKHRQGMARYLQTGTAAIMNRRLELTALRAGDVEFPIELTVTRFGQSEPPRFTAFIRDLTERHRSEELLRASYERMQVVARATNDAVWDWNLATNTIWWNEGYQTLFGYTPGERPSVESWDRLIHPEDVEATTHGINAVADGDGSSWVAEYRFRRSDGSYADILDRGYVIRDTEGRAVRMIGAMLDITERKQAENKLAASEAGLAAAQERAHLGSWELDLATMTGTASAEMARLLYQDPTNDRGTMENFRTMVHPEDLPIIDQSMAYALTAFEPYLSEYRTNPSLGPVRYLSATVHIIRDAVGHPERLAGTVLDVTDRRLAEKARQASEASYRALFEHAPYGIAIVDQENRYLDANAAMCAHFGYAREEWIGMPTSMIMAPSEQSSSSAMFPDFHATSEDQLDWKFKRKNGTIFDGEMIATRMPDGNLLCMVRDITKRKNLEQQFLRAQRMESIGTLAGGIAHDLNNALSPIIMSLDLLQMRFTDPASQQLLEVIGTSAQRGADMVRQVLSFARGVEGRRVEMKVKSLLHDIEKIVSETFLKHITVQTILPPDLWSILGDPTQLHQVLLNLCVNARDVMPNGGTLTLSAGNIVLDQNQNARGLNFDGQPGPYVFLQVEDTGSGMPPEVLEKIFDPFFTTKEVGKGTGLGLSTSQAIVKSHGGFVRVYSELGRGSQFRVYLPAHAGSISPETIQAISVMPRGNGELIMVVDDEESVRQITRQTLEAFGYRVLLACDGAEAVAAYAEKGKAISLVLTDMTMPVMDGPAAIQMLRKMNPTVPIIASSGFSAHSTVTLASRFGVNDFLPKPFTSETLLKMLQEVLAR